MPGAKRPHVSLIDYNDAACKKLRIRIAELGLDMVCIDGYNSFKCEFSILFKNLIAYIGSDFFIWVDDVACNGFIKTNIFINETNNVKMKIPIVTKSLWNFQMY